MWHKKNNIIENSWLLLELIWSGCKQSLSWCSFVLINKSPICGHYLLFKWLDYYRNLTNKLKRISHILLNPLYKFHNTLTYPNFNQILYGMNIMYSCINKQEAYSRSIKPLARLMTFHFVVANAIIHQANALDLPSQIKAGSIANNNHCKWGFFCVCQIGNRFWWHICTPA